MKFKAALKYRGLCESTLIEADYKDYLEKGRAWAAEFGLDEAPDFFIQQRGRWLKLDEQGEIFNCEFSAADYTREQL